MTKREVHKKALCSLTPEYDDCPEQKTYIKWYLGQPFSCKWTKRGNANCEFQVRIGSLETCVNVLHSKTTRSIPVAEQAGLIIHAQGEETVAGSMGCLSTSVLGRTVAGFGL